MRIIICPDSFKGSLSSVEAADAIERGVLRGVTRCPVETLKLPLADGGEGTVASLVNATGGEIRCEQVRDPLNREIDAFLGILGDGKTVVIEMSAASGLPLLAEHERDPLVATTYGTGELLLAAIDAGADKIILGLGGSAPNDGGAGVMSALGARFLDKAGKELPPGGAALGELDRIDLSSFKFPVGCVRVEVACDVDNPLTGPTGASAIYGPQKGATPDMIPCLDAALHNYAQVIASNLNKDVEHMPGAGAAGGLGAGLAAFVDARLRSGIEIVLDAVGFDAAIEDADLIITGEGRIDEQTAYGKTISGVLRRTHDRRIPVVAIAGCISGNIKALYDSGLTAAFSITRGPLSLEDAITNAANLIESTSANITRLAALRS